MATIPGSMMLVGASSPYRCGGLLYDKWKPDDDVLVVGGPSRVFNSTIPQWIVDDAMARDLATARAEWLGEWRDDIANYLSRDLIESAVDDGVIVRPPVSGQSVFGFLRSFGRRQRQLFPCDFPRRKSEEILLDCLVEIAAPLTRSVK